ncbi:MAG TPA: CsbD family protein [Bradyrhizobium sp.]|uniref:CsbD family protein n=1 Tax=Bradyrhizobium sp. TaxID=376 RepID=UPI002B9FA8AB|nr:CsbD family protein [Bradyrhizobium sp.]HLZ01694.1 CsbD family protein [Bradyrhizobium sp.]
MDKDRIRGSARQVKGSVKEAIGRVTGNKRTEAEGATEKAAGKVRGGVGKAKDAVRETIRTIRK